MKYFCFLYLFLLSSWSYAQSTIVLTNQSVGKMPLSIGQPISLYRIKHYFPNMTVTQQISSGDSSDYYLFRVLNRQGEHVLSFISYITSSDHYEESVVALDQVVAWSPSVVDQYGVAVGDRLITAQRKRTGLRYGTGHHNGYAGLNRLWYGYSFPQPHKKQRSNVDITSLNPTIQAIYWPNYQWR